MRRITVKFAKPGMVLELPVYDNYGNLLLYQGKILEQKSIAVLADKSVSELFIRDERVLDVAVAPLYSPQNEGLLASAFRQLVLENSEKPSLNNDHIRQVEAAVGKIIGDMSLNVLGDINVSCSIAAQDYVYLQPVKTAGLSLAMGQNLGMNKDELNILGMAAVFKDIGLSPKVIASVDAMAEGGSPRMREHPLAGYKILSQDTLTVGEVADAVLQHQECWSGSGYPQGLKGKAISRYARIIALADAFVDLLTVRPGRNKYMPHEAIEYIMAGGGDQFDPELVEVFVRQVPSYPSGISVELNTGEVGIITDPKRGFVARPVVRICYRPLGGVVKDTYDIDLSEASYQSMLITKVLGYS